MPRYLAEVLGTVPPPENGVPSPAVPDPTATVLLDFHAPTSAGLAEDDVVDVVVRVRIRTTLPG